MNVLEKYKSDCRALASVIGSSNTESMVWMLHCISAGVILALFLFTLQTIHVPAKFHLIVIAPFCTFILYALCRSLIARTQSFCKHMRELFRGKL